jgi:hypothetical protein
MSRNPDHDDPDRPRRRDDDDDYEDRPRRPPQRAGLDGMFLDTNMVLLVLFGICCGGIALILSIIELAIGKHPEAKRRATIVLIISAIMTAVGLVAQFAGLFQFQQGGRRF